MSSVRRSRACMLTPLLAAVVATTASSLAWAQLPATSGGSPATPPYRAPSIALVQPASGGSVPRDKPVVFFRFAPGEAGDPIDVGSFAVTVDGADVTQLFQVTATEAWGPIRAHDDRGELTRADDATHTVAARICSARGACATVTATVTTMASPAVTEGEPASRRERFIDLLLRAARRLLDP